MGEDSSDSVDGTTDRDAVARLLDDVRAELETLLKDINDLLCMAEDWESDPPIEFPSPGSRVPTASPYQLCHELLLQTEDIVANVDLTSDSPADREANILSKSPNSALCL